MGGDTGTNSDAIAVTRAGVPTALVSIPERHMHTPAEIVDLRDVENTARLLAEYLWEAE
jgi:endoglucanase